MPNRHHLIDHIPENRKFLLKGAVLLFLVLFLAAALSVPFYFETMTLWYKTGADKLMLRSGQLAGMSALVLLFLQIILGVQGRFLSELFGNVTLSRFHKVNAGIILLLVFFHVLLVLIPEGITNLPIGKKYWPEMIGGVLFIILLILIISSYFRSQLNLPFNNWRALHRPLGYICLILLPVHVIFASDSFEHPQLRSTLLAISGGLILWVVVVKILQLFD